MRPTADAATKPVRPIELAAFRKAMGSFASGVTVVTVLEGGHVHGMTANAFMSGSADPRLCVVSVDKRARTHALIPAAMRFGIGVLSQDQEDAARHFAGQKGVPDTHVFEELVGVPVLAGCVAQIACALRHALECGDHTLYVGEVLGLVVVERAPLAYYRGAFRKLAMPTIASAPALDFW